MTLPDHSNEAEIVLLRQALDQAAVDLRGLGADLDGEMREFVFDTACPRIRDAIAASIRRVGISDWALRNVAQDEKPHEFFASLEYDEVGGGAGERSPHWRATAYRGRSGQPVGPSSNLDSPASDESEAK